ncbi:hypothetical protein F5B21DRAFT_429928 [Xylaria acuta]|nr:hypothetical protein F5B21DRAFT_429928 [Xylaria acuta]
MWDLLSAYGLLERRIGAETIREDDGRNDDEYDTTTTPVLTPFSTSSSSDYVPVPSDQVLSPPPPALLAAARDTVFRDTPRGPVDRERHQDTTDDFWEESRQPGSSRGPRACPGATVPQPGFSPGQSGEGKNTCPGRSCIPGDNWPRGQVERPWAPPPLLPLTGWRRLVGWFAGDSSRPGAQRPDEDPSERPNSRLYGPLVELSNLAAALDRGGHTPTTTTTTEIEPTSPEPATEPARPRYTHGLAMARVTGHLRITGSYRTPLRPRGPARSDGRDARADQWVVVPPWLKEYPGKYEWDGPWRDDQRKARSYSESEIAEQINLGEKLWFYEDIRKWHYKGPLKRPGYAALDFAALGLDGHNRDHRYFDREKVKESIHEFIGTE